MKSIYIILCAIGLEPWMTGCRLPGLDEISVADWLDNWTSRQRLALWLSILLSACAVHLIVYQVPISAMTTLGQTLTVLALCILPAASCELAYLNWQTLHRQEILDGAAEDTQQHDKLKRVVKSSFWSEYLMAPRFYLLGLMRYEPFRPA